MEKLCERCQTLEFGPQTSIDKGILVEKLGERISRREECSLCFLTVQAIQLLHGGNHIGDEYLDRECSLKLHRQAPGSTVSRIEVDTRPSLRQNREKITVDSRSPFCGCIKRVIDDAQSLSEQRSYYRPLQQGLADFSLIRKWRNLCKTIHGDHCSDPEWLHVKPPLCLLVIDVHKRVIIEAPPDCEYTALSYVWGKVVGEEHISSQEDLKQLPKALLEPDKMPRTIEDAIRVTKDIGLDYLWVDAICIAQKPSENSDKTHHLEQMDLIFKSAEVVIAAAASMGAAAGFHPEGDIHRRDIIRSVGGAKFAVSKPQFNDYIESTIWTTRAWTFQEQLLARRLLLIGAHESYWLCQCDLWCESEVCEPDPLDPSSIPALPNTSKPPMRVLDIDKDDYGAIEPGEIQTLKAYVTLISKYTLRQLGRPEDGVHAVWGVVKMLQRFDPQRWDVLYYGLPAVYFDVAVLWTPKFSVQRDDSLRVRQKLPSWCWAGWLGSKSFGVYWCDSLFAFNGDIKIVPCIQWYYLDEHGRSLPQKTFEKLSREWAKLEVRRPCGIKEDAQPQQPPDRPDLTITSIGYYLHFLTTSTTFFLGPTMYHYHYLGFETMKERAPQAIVDEHGGFAGSILLTDDEADPIRAAGLPLEFVCISYAEEAEPQATGAWLLDGPTHDIPAGTLSWSDHGFSENYTGKFELVNALWIRRISDGTVERLGIAKILNSAWLKSDPQTEWIVMG